MARRMVMLAGIPYVVNEFAELYYKACARCNGTGQLGEIDCYACGGTGAGAPVGGEMDARANALLRSFDLSLEDRNRSKARIHEVVSSDKKQLELFRSHPRIFGFMRRVDPRKEQSNFLRSAWFNLFDPYDGWRKWSEKMNIAIMEIMIEREEKERNVRPTVAVQEPS